MSFSLQIAPLLVCSNYRNCKDVWACMKAAAGISDKINSLKLTDVNSLGCWLRWTGREVLIDLPVSLGGCETISSAGLAHCEEQRRTAKLWFPPVLGEVTRLWTWSFSLESNEWLGADPISGHVLFFISSRRYFVVSGRFFSCDFSMHRVVSHILLYRSLLIWCWMMMKNLVWDAVPFPAPLCSPLSGVSCWEEAVGWKFALPGDRCLPLFKHKEQVA